VSPSSSRTAAACGAASAIGRSSVRDSSNRSRSNAAAGWRVRPSAHRAPARARLAHRRRPNRRPRCEPPGPDAPWDRGCRPRSCWPDRADAGPRADHRRCCSLLDRRRPREHRPSATDRPRRQPRRARRPAPTGRSRGQDRDARHAPPCRRRAGRRRCCRDAPRPCGPGSPTASDPPSPDRPPNLDADGHPHAADDHGRHVDHHDGRRVGRHALGPNGRHRCARGRPGPDHRRGARPGPRRHRVDRHRAAADAGWHPRCLHLDPRRHPGRRCVAVDRCRSSSLDRLLHHGRRHHRPWARPSHPTDVPTHQGHDETKIHGIQA
jgi:hypothetical protein